MNKKDFDCFNLHLSKIKLNYNDILKIKIIDENDLYSQKSISSYYLQMLLKLLVSEHIKQNII